MRGVVHENMRLQTILIGVYRVDEQPEVHLLEVLINANHSDIDIGKFTQEQDGVDRLDW